jgi:hypothetical protein
MAKITKEQMKGTIRQVGEDSEDYLMNVLNCMDVFWDAMDYKLNRMSKKELQDLYEQAIKDPRYHSETKFCKHCKDILTSLELEELEGYCKQCYEGSGEY